MERIFVIEVGISFLNELELVMVDGVCPSLSGREYIRLSLDQKSVFDYIITDAQESGDVCNEV